jgi:hypothetical protein
MDGAIPPLAHMPSWCVQGQVLGDGIFHKIVIERIRNS